MTLLAPLGLLGLLGIVALIIIYILKPNYQNKYISSTYVWKLSLKYRKKKIPTSKLRNILLIICQILILTACALILAQPNTIIKAQVKEREVIAIIDSSASMRTECSSPDYPGQIRFEKAVDEVGKLSQQVLTNDGIMTVIVADESAEYLLYPRVYPEKLTELQASLNELVEDNTVCSYGSSDIDNALLLSEDILDENPNAEIHIFTDTKYEALPDGIKVTNVSSSEEWNAGILDAYSQLYEGYYTFNVDIATYGRSSSVLLYLEVYGANPGAENPEGLNLPPFYDTVFCPDGTTMRVVFIEEKFIPAEPEENVVYVPIADDFRVSSYKYVHLSLELNEPDSFSVDDDFYIYDGRKEQIKIQYTSSEPRGEFSAALSVLKSNLANTWDLNITQIKKGESGVTSGFDLYIYENVVPNELPKDGVIWFSNPQAVPAGAGFVYEGKEDLTGSIEPYYMVKNPEYEAHPLVKNLSNTLSISQYNRFNFTGYESLLTCNGDTVLALKNDGTTKILVMPFAIRYSSLSLNNYFVLFVNNVLNYFFPRAVSGNSFEVNEQVTLKARGEELILTGYDYVEETYVETVYTSFPTTFIVSTPGTYTLSQTTVYGETLIEDIYVKIPAIESNVFRTEETVISPIRKTDNSEFFNDLLLYLAAALVALLFVEWWLQSRDNM